MTGCFLLAAAILKLFFEYIEIWALITDNPGIGQKDKVKAAKNEKQRSDKCPDD